MMRRNLPRSDRILRSMVRSGAANLAYESDTDSRGGAPTGKGSSAKAHVARTTANRVVPPPARLIISVDSDNSKVAEEPIVGAPVVIDNNKSKDDESNANCNCKTLTRQTECIVCFESFQGSQLKTCTVCANIVCGPCASKLTSCAFCRSNLPLERNRALEKFVDELLLPCRNAKSGCKQILDGENRRVHESICSYLPLTCPFGRNRCSWQGTVVNVQSHLRTGHNLQPLKGNGLSVKVPGICQKTENVSGRVYSVLLSCYEQLFVVRVMTFQGQFRLCFTRLGSEDPQSKMEETKPSQYGIQMVMSAQSGRTLKGLIPFHVYDRERCTDVTVACDRLYSSASPEETNKIHPGTCHGNPVKIDLQVRKIEVQP